jgi:hypothetical protein
MTALEMVDGKYYEQGSDEYQLAIENMAKEYPQAKTECLLVRQFWNQRVNLERAVVLAGTK